MTDQPRRRFDWIALLLALIVGCAPAESTGDQPVVEGDGGDEAASVEQLPANGPFAEPTGLLPVGVLDVAWLDPSRPEPFTKDPNDVRSVAARVWYPAAPGGAGGASYVPDTNQFDDGFDAVAGVQTHATSDAPVGSGGPFPVVLYNHGGGWPRFTSTFTTEELASHGYVVVSIGHNGMNQVQRLLDGTSVEPDTMVPPRPTGDLRADAYGSWAHLEQHHFPEWVADAVHALGRLDEMNREGPLAGTLDLESIGMYGWSFGGATSIELAAIDERVKAAIDQDGQLFGSASTRGTARPFMLMHSSEPPAPPESAGEEEREMFTAVMQELSGVTREAHASLKSLASGDWYDVTIAGTNHGSFSDLTLFYPGASPGIDPARAHEIINSLTVAFFDRYLKGTDSSLLESPSERFPEVTLDRRVQPPGA